MKAGDTRTYKNKIKKQLRKLVESHAELKAYHDSLEKLLVKPFFTVVAFNTYGMCACGIVLLTSNYYGAIGNAMSAMSQLLLVCVMGTFICIQHDRLFDDSWQFDWYKLEKSDQKDFLQVLTFAQQPLNLEPYFVGVLNMELFIKVSMIEFRFNSIKIVFVNFNCDRL